MEVEAISSLTARLSEYDFLVCIDCSGSMGAVDRGESKSRYAKMQETVESFCRDIEKIDSDGIDLVFFGATVNAYPAVTSAKVAEVFSMREPRGGTPLGKALNQAFSMAGMSAKKDFILVFTDGVPDNEAEVRDAIVAQTMKQSSDDACTVLFVQVGNDTDATRFLKNLDDNLRGAKYDIVDAMTVDEANQFASTAEMVLKAIND